MTKREAITILSLRATKATVALSFLNPNCDVAKDFREEIDALEMAMEALKGSTIENNSTVESGWIPCAKRLPEYEETVLVSFKDSDDIETAIYEKYGDRGAFCTSEGHCGIFPTGEGIVTAWMPRPKPYKEERENA